MTEEIKKKVADLLDELKALGMPALFIASDGENDHSMRNVKLQTAAVLIANHVSQDEMNPVFVACLETMYGETTEENKSFQERLNEKVKEYGKTEATNSSTTGGNDIGS